MNAEPRRRFDDPAGGFGAGAVPGGARQSTGGGPAAITVRNDGHVQTRSQDRFPASGDQVLHSERLHVYYFFLRHRESSVNYSILQSE
jgi:hypothetical protein